MAASSTSDRSILVPVESSSVGIHCYEGFINSEVNFPNNIFYIVIITVSLTFRMG